MVWFRWKFYFHSTLHHPSAAGNGGRRGRRVKPVNPGPIQLSAGSCIVSSNYAPPGSCPRSLPPHQAKVVVPHFCCTKGAANRADIMRATILCRSAFEIIISLTLLLLLLLLSLFYDGTSLRPLLVIDSVRVSVCSVPISPPFIY